jgi:1,4-alpha-glucan branching enzyme
LSQPTTRRRRRARQVSETSWFNDAIIYGINLATFQDGDADGIGDFAGLTSRLDYLADLGVDCLWLLPFYPSPRRDNGYDVSNYYDIDPLHLVRYHPQGRDRRELLPRGGIRRLAV